VITDDSGSRMFVCSDTEFCSSRRDAGHVGRLSPVGGAQIQETVQ